MTDEKAKEILDFIAQRIGWQYMSIRHDVLYKPYGYMPYLERSDMATPLWLETAKDSNILYYNECPSWKRALEDILNKNRNCKHKLRITDGMHNIVVNWNENEESIMIDMDLHQARKDNGI